MTQEHKCLASLMTAKTIAAISGIQLVGVGSADILRSIFIRLRQGFGGQGAKTDFKVGDILHGNIIDGGKIIDEVIIGCEEENSFSISCHGNPLIVEDILELLKKHGVKITIPNEVLVYPGGKKHGENTISVEADLEITQSQTLEGARIIAHQTRMGLFQTAEWWRKNMNCLELDDISTGIEQILADSNVADLFVKGAKVVLAGPPNSGKSTLFNYLCGREKSIVTDVAGTTRDWLSAQIRLKKIKAEFIDTAGLCEILSGENTIDAQAQEQAKELVKTADLVLFVVDGSVQNTEHRIQNSECRQQINKLVVYNKCDLPHNIFTNGLNPTWGIKISAKTGEGIDKLKAAIERELGVMDFDMRKTVCFTLRQRTILRQIASAKTKKTAEKLIIELLTGGL